eukprot:357556-Chlamydomonas_euryale.AAC.2
MHTRTLLRAQASREQYPEQWALICHTAPADAETTSHAGRSYARIHCSAVGLNSAGACEKAPPPCSSCTA